jgi:peptide/nickel transport system permease protein
LILTAARGKDYPMLEAGILVVGAAYILAAVAGDMLIGVLDPRGQAARR